MRDMVKIYSWNVPDEIRNGKEIYTAFWGADGPELRKVNELKYGTFVKLNEDNAIFVMFKEPVEDESANNVNQCEQ